MQQAKLPALDIGLDEIDTIEPECRNDGVEGGLRYQPLRDRAPARQRSCGGARWAKPKPRLALPLTGRLSVSSPEAAPNATANRGGRPVVLAVWRA